MAISASSSDDGRDRPAEIVAAAIVLIHESGRPRVPMSAVAARSGIALKTIYRCFESQELLFAAALAGWHAQVLQRALVDRSGSLQERAERYLIESTKMFADDIGMARLLIHLMAVTSPDVTTVLNAMQTEADNRLADYLEGATAADQLPTIVTILHALKTRAATEVARATEPLTQVHSSLRDAVALIFAERVGAAYSS